MSNYVLNNYEIKITRKNNKELTFIANYRMHQIIMYFLKISLQ